MKEEEFKAKASQRIDEVSAKINKLKAKKEPVQGDSKSKYKESLKEIESKKAALEEKYTELENASEEKWGEVKNAFSSASESFKEGWNKVISLFSMVIILFFFGSCGSFDKENKTTGEAKGGYTYMGDDRTNQDYSSEYEPRKNRRQDNLGDDRDDEYRANDRENEYRGREF